MLFLGTSRVVERNDQNNARCCITDNHLLNAWREVDMAGQQKQKPLKCMFYGVVSAEFMSIYYRLKRTLNISIATHYSVNVRTVVMDGSGF